MGHPTQCFLHQYTIDLVCCGVFSFECEDFVLISPTYLVLCLGMQISIYIGFLDGSSHHTRNLALVAWVVYSPHNELVSSGGFFIGLSTNNFSKYHAIISLLTKASFLGISHIVVCLILNSWFHNSIMSMLSAILFCYNFT